ncbi:GNAT family N-acetyltransferase [Algoriphagus zhangzhouensis]|jgi:RimJ/RimL family protein N-acetyltransferase|uniref:Protein N-acetyltransferase, RimJ/RimL family n=1 Tax=Algoriphagus zhangzhouensis TaxID=1073327 RepID=A0A1M7ZAX1_9BACT|nr:GNAT family N-acetyltransferase [Algoriphagus zhangzhouensis]TDY47081.1 RimJ/RimL family protein N-acetyltransferase [Algoriphagus zhangzhouensis]SHO61960.1 Protein N-acetyltransferase, RimJ/RimL family [Algoriphagus zhangzhouensis]
MIISGERDINLVTWNEAHFHQLYPLANNPKIAMNLRDSFPQPYTIHDARHWIEHNQKFNPPHNFAIEFEGKLAGSIGCDRGKDELRTNMELGFWVGEQFWGKGIATEAVKLFTQHLLDRFDIQRIYAQVYDFNVESMNVLEKAGYIPEAILKKAFIKRGVVGDIFQYVKIRGES